ncbi:MAG: ABC transporter permease [Fimbriiglobus sp.]
MYKTLLCWQYLRTRYLAFVCIVSVMLGVATLIVVNSVMSGFSNKLKDRLQGILSDVIIETSAADGLPESAELMEAKIKASKAGPYVACMSPTVEVMALMQHEVRNRHGDIIPLTKHVRVLGIDPVRHAQMGKFRQYLKRQKNNENINFDLTQDGEYRFRSNRLFNTGERNTRPNPNFEIPVVPAPAQPAEPQPKVGAAMFHTDVKIELPQTLAPPPVLPAAPPMRIPGAFVGHAMAHQHTIDPETGMSRTFPLLREGDDVFIATVGASGIKPVYNTFTVADYFHTEMSEYDNTFIYVPLADLQNLRGMGNRVNTLQIRLTEEAIANPEIVQKVVLPELRRLFEQDLGTHVATWQEHQGPLLEAIDVERGILNLLLFMIVGVSGFSILAIFTMIVSEKYRDIGIMKSLGATSQGVMSIFLTYGLMLGGIGCALGTIAGLLITEYINPIERGLASLTGQQIFDRKIYYFDEIPTNIESMTVLLVNVGAVAISVVFSILPAVRAARLQPVRALRFEESYGARRGVSTP